MQIEVTQNMLDWYKDTEEYQFIQGSMSDELKKSIEKALEKEKPKLPDKISISTSHYANTQYAVTTINQLIDYLKAKENERIIEP